MMKHEASLESVSNSVRHPGGESGWVLLVQVAPSTNPLIPPQGRIAQLPDQMVDVDDPAMANILVQITASDDRVDLSYDTSPKSYPIDDLLPRFVRLEFCLDREHIVDIVTIQCERIPGRRCGEPSKRQREQFEPSVDFSQMRWVRVVWSQGFSPVCR